MNDLINLPENATTADFLPFVEAGEAFGSIQSTAAGKQYIEGTPGQFSAGQVAVRFVVVREGTGRRSSWAFVGWRKEIVGTVTGAGKSFLFSTKEGAMAADKANAADVYHARFYIEA